SIPSTSSSTKTVTSPMSNEAPAAKKRFAPSSLLPVLEANRAPSTKTERFLASAFVTTHSAGKPAKSIQEIPMHRNVLEYFAANASNLHCFSRQNCGLFPSPQFIQLSSKRLRMN